ncbi:polyprenol reductase 2-like [Humulus lupulus]|uniref:polyprenol reductase 2-like n=1 Tax=Humulus lupulus TaxID=3486 RepID=UPI002B40C7DE|nr:polyprenol reductase 2-like [Humulus lupulus]XP_062076931.1 polyprenol reductase 2-like [Humulus lupulus]XP_062076932.1 polyprenol reductase 2-like [Humulus lupulus]
MELGLVWLLRAAWIAGTLPILIASIPSSSLSSVHGLVLNFAKRGKIMNSSSKRFTLPQKYFGHFYAVASVWTTFLLVTTWMYAYKTVPIVSKPFHYSTFVSQIAGGSQIFSWLKSHTAPVEYKYSVWRSVFLLLLMEVQVLRRLYETIYVFNYSSSARMHILGYLTGLFFYTAGPLSLCCNCIPEVYEFVLNGVAEFIVKGKNRMPALEFDWWEFAIPLVKLGWLQWIGAAVFFWGWVHQLRCHAILGSLREHKAQADEYVIPHGDWFKIVSSPHYLAEIVLYFGVLIASGGRDLTIWLLFIFVVANLVFAAAETHRWYLRKFENYPRSRLAIIPFLY